MSIGIRGHDLLPRTPEELAVEISSLGLSCVQLALPKSFGIGESPGQLTPGFAHRVSKAFHKHNVQIAVLGCYINLIHPDKEARRTGIKRFKEHIRFARDFGCGIVGTETGNINEEIVYTEKNFQEEPFREVVESVKELVAEAEKFGVIVGIEPGINHPVYSPNTMRRLLDEVDSNNLQVIFDPTNLITIGNYKDQNQVLQEALDLWGERIIVFHAKDYNIANDNIKQVPLGRGLLDYPFLMKAIERKKPHINIIMDEIEKEHIADSKQYIESLLHSL